MARTRIRHPSPHPFRFDPPVGHTGADTADCLGLPLLDDFDVDGDFHLVAYDHSPGLDRLVPGEPEIFPVDFRGRYSPDTRLPRGIPDGRGRPLDVQHDLFGHPADGQVPRHLEFSVACFFHLFRFEYQGGILCGIQEIGAFQMFVTFGHAGVDGGGIDGDVRRGSGDVPLVVDDFPRYFFKIPAHMGNHQMTHLELDSCVDGGEFPRCRGTSRRKRQKQGGDTDDPESPHLSPPVQEWVPDDFADCGRIMGGTMNKRSMRYYNLKTTSQNRKMMPPTTAMTVMVGSPLVRVVPPIPVRMAAYSAIPACTIVSVLLPWTRGGFPSSSLQYTLREAEDRWRPPHLPPHVAI